MTDKEQTDHFADELDRLINRFSREYELCYSQVVGVLQMKIHTLCTGAQKRQDEL